MHDLSVVTIRHFHSPLLPQIKFSGELNDSQLVAVEDMLDLDKKVSIIKGPPGTGKTTVIAAVVSSLLANSRHTGFIITQSNVGAKNIAEKLVTAGIQDWVLLVSSEYMKGWYVPPLVVSLLSLMTILHRVLGMNTYTNTYRQSTLSRRTATNKYPPEALS